MTTYNLVRISSIFFALILGGWSCGEQLPPEVVQAGNARLNIAFDDMKPKSGTKYMYGSSASFEANMALIEGRQICRDVDYDQEFCTRSMEKGVRLAEQADSKGRKKEATTVAKIEEKHLDILFNRIPPLIGNLKRRGLLPDGTRTGDYESPGGRFTLVGEDLPDLILPIGEEMPSEYRRESLEAVQRLLGQMREFPAVAKLSPEEAVELYAKKRLRRKASSPPREVAEGSSRSGSFSEPLYLEIRRGGTIKNKGVEDYTLEGGTFKLQDHERQICLSIKGRMGTGACFLAVRDDLNVKLCDKERVQCTEQLGVSIIEGRDESTHSLRIPTTLGVTGPIPITLSERTPRVRIEVDDDDDRRPFGGNLDGGKLGLCTYKGVREVGSNLPIYTCEQGRAPAYTYDGSRLEPLRGRQGGDRGRNDKRN